MIAIGIGLFVTGLVMAISSGFFRSRAIKESVFAVAGLAIIIGLACIAVAVIKIAWRYLP